MARQFAFTIEETGVKELLKLFETDVEKANAALSDATHRAIELVEGVARSSVKKVTGGMESKISVKQQKTKVPTKKAWQVSCKDPGASSLEGGNSRMAAQPFFRPALDKNKTTIETIISSVLVERMGGA
jgi:HK97 gp10 family phage protein